MYGFDQCRLLGHEKNMARKRAYKFIIWDRKNALISRHHRNKFLFLGAKRSLQNNFSVSPLLRPFDRQKWRTQLAGRQWSVLGALVNSLRYHLRKCCSGFCAQGKKKDENLGFEPRENVINVVFEFLNRAVNLEAPPQEFIPTKHCYKEL